MRRFGRYLALATFALMAGCGGGPAVDSAGVALEESRAVADVNALVDLDLPGCECPGLVERGERVRVLRHPLHDGLVVVDVEGRGPACIDSPRAALEAMRASAARLAPVYGGDGHLSRAANIAPEDDPVPIKDSEAEGDGGENGNSEGEGENKGAGNEQSGPDQQDGRGGDPGGVVKLSENNDDPVPIRDLQAHLQALLANSN